jgi:hypothetical protein
MATTTLLLGGRPTSWMHRSLMHPDTIFDLVEQHFIGFLLRVGYEKYTRTDMFPRLIEHLHWARQKRQPLFAFLYFWYFYVLIDEIRAAVDAVELESRPWITPETLLHIREFAKNRIWDLQTSAFLPQNAPALLHKLHQVMCIGIVCRNGHVLAAPEPNPRSVIRLETVDLAAQIFGETALLMIQKIAKRTETLQNATRYMEQVFRDFLDAEQTTATASEPHRDRRVILQRCLEEIDRYEQQREPWLRVLLTTRWFMATK